MGETKTVARINGEDGATILPPLSGIEVRMWRSLLAYNLGNLWRRLGLPGGIKD